MFGGNLRRLIEARAFEHVKTRYPFLGFSERPIRCEDLAVPFANGDGLVHAGQAIAGDSERGGSRPPEWQRPEADGRAGRQSPMRLHVVVGPRDHGASGPGGSSVDLTIGVSMFVGPPRSSQICWPANCGTEIARLTILAG